MKMRRWCRIMKKKMKRMVGVEMGIECSIRMKWKRRIRMM
jgi:hypothetical protein